MNTISPCTQQSGSEYDGLCFSFSEMEHEIENMRLLARPFLETASAEWIIHDWRQQLSAFQGQPPESQTRWSIKEAYPIQTIISDGEYEPSGKKGRKIFGRASGAWDIQIPQSSIKKRGGAQKSFVLNGLASTEVSIWEHRGNEQGPQKLAHWTIEVGDAGSPGCHFHTLVKHSGVESKPLSVPRLPTLLYTPMDALDFLLGELFQDKWAEHISQENDFLRNWSHCQRLRLTKLLAWQLEKIETAGGSPWMAFKKQKPPRNLFYG